MPSLMETPAAKLSSLWKGSSIAHRILIGGTLVSLTIAFLLVVFWLNRADYKVLYSGLYSEDAATVVEMLQKEKVDYRLQDSGGTILVPADKVYDLRLKVAGQGAMHGQGVGFEIFDESKIGQTEFVQHINYQRALQGELARTISEIPGVERARVHIVLPNKSLFIEEQNAPSASVMVKLSGGTQLSSGQVQSVLNLVGTSVEGLTRENITLSDTDGRLLYEPQGEAGAEGLSSTQVEYKAAVEKRLQQSLEQLLTPVLGPGKVIARVNADLDFSRRTIRKELFDPDSAVVRSEQKTDEENTGSMQAEAGVPEAAFNGPDAAGPGSTQTSTRSSATTNFEINREEQNIISQIGGVERLSVAVIVDGVYEPGPDGGEVFTPRSDEEMQRIEGLVKSAMGFDSARGDAVQVSSIAFRGMDMDIEEPETMDTVMHYARMFARPVLNTLLVLLFLLLVVRPLVLALIRPKVEGEARPGSAGLPEGQRRMALGEGQAGTHIAKDSPHRFEEFKEQAMESVEKNLDQAVAQVKNWLKEGEA
ncbi:MAG: flagellar basal-body MS-ring/collar protein FliF [Desulfovibrionales bacterium]